MRGAFYVTTALLITNSIRTAAEANRSEYRQTSYHDGVAPGSMDTAKSLPRRSLQGSHEPHDNLGVTAAEEERMPEPSMRITALLSEEALDTMRKAVQSTYDLNAPPEETSTGMVEAYQLLRKKDPRSVTASHFKRTTQALTSLNEASGFAIPTNRADGQSKKLRTSVSLEATEVQNHISRDKMTLASRFLSNDEVQSVHSLYLQHLRRNSAVFEPTEDETRRMLGLILDTENWIPNLDQTYAPYAKEVMEMKPESLKELGLDSKTALEPSFREILEHSSEDYEEIQLCLLRLLRLKRWKHMYPDFFSFCHSNHEIRKNLSAASTLQRAIQTKNKFAVSSAEVAVYSAVLEKEKTRNTKAERVMIKDLKDAVKNADLEWADKRFVFKTLKGISQDDYKFVASDRSTLVADALIFRADGPNFDVLKTPPSSGANGISLPGGQGKGSRDRKQIFELVDRAKKRQPLKNKFIVEENERSIVMIIRDKFMMESKPDFAPTPELIKRMQRMFNWKEDSSDPRRFRYAGHYLLDHVCRLDQIKLKTVLGPERIRLVNATQHTKEGDAKFLEELRTEYLMILLETYDKFYPFCERHRELCTFEELLFDHPEPSH